MNIDENILIQIMKHANLGTFINIMIAGGKYLFDASYQNGLIKTFQYTNDCIEVAFQFHSQADEEDGIEEILDAFNIQEEDIINCQCDACLQKIEDIRYFKDNKQKDLKSFIFVHPQRTYSDVVKDNGSLLVIYSNDARSFFNGMKVLLKLEDDDRIKITTSVRVSMDPEIFAFIKNEISLKKKRTIKLFLLKFSDQYSMFISQISRKTKSLFGDKNILQYVIEPEDFDGLE